MKIAFCLSFLVLMGFNTFSQDYYYSPESTKSAKKSITDTTDFSTKPIFGIKAGLNLSNMLIKDDADTYSDEFKMKPGFHIGTSVEFPINEMFSFETGLSISTKGFKYSYQGYYGPLNDLSYYNSIGSENLIYLDIPITTKFYFNTNNLTRIYGVIGTYFGVGLVGWDKWTDTDLEDGTVDSDSDKIKFGYSDDSYYKPFDFGLIGGAGFEFNQIKLELFYEYGLSDIDDYNENGDRTKNRVFGISMGYIFHGK